MYVIMHDACMPHCLFRKDGYTWRKESHEKLKVSILLLAVSHTVHALTGHSAHALTGHSAHALTGHSAYALTGHSAHSLYI